MTGYVFAGGTGQPEVLAARTGAHRGPDRAPRLACESC